jgi:hypothetical protein
MRARMRAIVCRFICAVHWLSTDCRSPTLASSDRLVI